jgi:hypothetical protein
MRSSLRSECFTVFGLRCVNFGLDGEFYSTQRLAKRFQRLFLNNKIIVKFDKSSGLKRPWRRAVSNLLAVLTVLLSFSLEIWPKLQPLINDCKKWVFCCCEAQRPQNSPFLKCFDTDLMFRLLFDLKAATAVPWSNFLRELSKHRPDTCH